MSISIVERCSSYEIKGEKFTMPPFVIKDFETYETVTGWRIPKHRCNKLEDLLGWAWHYLERLKERFKVPLQTVMAGPKRELIT